MVVDDNKAVIYFRPWKDLRVPVKDGSRSQSGGGKSLDHESSCAMGIGDRWLWLEAIVSDPWREMSETYAVHREPRRLTPADKPLAPGVLYRV